MPSLPPSRAKRSERSRARVSTSTRHRRSRCAESRPRNICQHGDYESASLSLSLFLSKKSPNARRNGAGVVLAGWRRVKIRVQGRMVALKEGRLASLPPCYLLISSLFFFFLVSVVPSYFSSSSSVSSFPVATLGLFPFPRSYSI